MTTHEVGITTYKDGSAWDICLLNLSAHDEAEICRFLLQMRHDFEISFLDEDDSEAVIFSVHPSEMIGQYIKKWAKDKSYEFDRREESSK